MRVNDKYISFYHELDNDIREISIGLRKTALLIVDMQRALVCRPDIKNLSEKELYNYKRWEPFYDRIEKVVIPNNQRILETFRRKNMEVIFSKLQCLKKDGSDRPLVQKKAGFRNLLLPIGSKDSEIIPELMPKENEIVITKTTHSTITGTNLRLTLHNMGIDTVVVTGVFTDRCVSSTVRSLADESFKVWLIEDATMAATEEIHEHELKILNNTYCHVINTHELLLAITGGNVIDNLEI